MGETFQVGEFSAVLEPRGRHLLCTETGECRDAAELTTYLAQIERLLARTNTTRVLFDARKDAAPRRGDKETRDARWEWIRTSPRAKQIAVIAENEIAMTRINMTARANKVALRAFLDFESAEAWLDET